MKVNVRMKSQKNARRFAAWASQRIDETFDRFSNSIQRIDAFFADLNGPKGGHDKNLLLAVRMWNGQVVAVRSVGDELGEVLDKGLNRTMASLRKFHEKQSPHRMSPWENYPKEAEAAEAP
jgi:hypothetical protein